MHTLRHIFCITILLLAGLPCLAQEPPVDPELLLELGAMTTESDPADEEHALMLELNMDPEGRAWLEQEMLPGTDGTQPGQPGTIGRLLLELSPLSAPPGLGSDPDVTADFTAAHPGVLLLDLSAMTTDQFTEEELAALTEQNSGLLLLELDQSFDGNDPDRQTQSPDTLLLELALNADAVTPDNQDTLLLVLEAIEGGPALRPLNDADSQLLLSYAPFLVGHWRLTEGQGPTAWDYSDYEHEGALSEQLQLGWTADGLQFGQGYIEVADEAALNVQEAFTMSAWVYLQDVMQDQKILGKLAPDRASGFLLRVLDGRLCPMIWDAAESAYADLWGSIPADTWTHIAVTWNRGRDLIGYMNGAEVGRIRASARPVGVSDTALMIGANPLDAASAPVHGVVVEVRLYETQLPATAIKLLAAGWRKSR